MKEQIERNLEIIILKIFKMFLRLLNHNLSLDFLENNTSFRFHTLIYVISFEIIIQQLLRIEK